MIELLGKESTKEFFCRNQNQPKSRTFAHIRDGGKEVGGE
jgi:hypothetical protein